MTKDAESLAVDKSQLCKLTTFQNLIPQFDNNSAVTAKYFFDTIETLANKDEYTDDERLIIAKSRIRGDALTHLINSPSLSSEKNYGNFKDKFLDFFEQKTSRTVCQYQFSNIKMYPSETVRQFANRVCNATDKFFGPIDLSQEPLKQVYDQTLLSKFLEGIRDEYKREILTKDPKNLKEAISFIELLETNEQIMKPQTVNAIERPNELLQKHIQSTHEMIAALSKKIESLSVRPNLANNPQIRKFCSFCKRNNHSNEECYFKNKNEQTTTTFRNSHFPRSRPLFRQQRDSRPSHYNIVQ